MTDEKLLELGFVKDIDNEYCVYYSRIDPKYNFTQVLCIMHKNSGRHLLSSYDRNLFDEKKIGNSAVGLTYLETRLALKKMKEKGWKSK